MKKTSNKKIQQKIATESGAFSSKFTLLVGAGLIVTGCASVQPHDNVTDTALSDHLIQKIDERDRKIAERDQVIDDLQRRVKQLEQNKLVYLPVEKGSNTVATAEIKTTLPDKTAGVSSPPLSQTLAQKKTVMPSQAKGGAGSFEVDEDSAQRALERTLIVTGALLLPYGLAEVQPFSTYTRRAYDVTTVFQSSPGILANASIRQNKFDIGSNLLVGLPFESQFELRVPYDVTNQSVVTPNGSNNQENSNTGNSLGDVNIGLAKTLLRESEWIPDLIARQSWTAGTGSLENNNVYMGGGFNSFTTSLVALKRQDPLAFSVRGGYQTFLENNNIQLGDQYSVSLSTTLAASPQTSLTFGLQQTFAQQQKINNIALNGSDVVSSAFTLGAASTIGKRLFFSVTGGVGLTNSSPDYFLNIIVPYRFDMPFTTTKTGS